MGQSLKFYYLPHQRLYLLISPSAFVSLSAAPTGRGVLADELARSFSSFWGLTNIATVFRSWLWFMKSAEMRFVLDVGFWS